MCCLATMNYKAMKHRDCKALQGPQGNRTTGTAKQWNTRTVPEGVRSD